MPQIRVDIMMVNSQLKRSDHIEFNFKGQMCTGTVLHATKTKVFVYIHMVEPSKEKGTIRFFIINAAKFTCKKVDLSKVNAKHHPLINQIFSVKKGDLVKVYDDEIGYFYGHLKQLTQEGYTIQGLDSTCTFSFGYSIESVNSCVDDDPMPLDRWSAVESSSAVIHDSGGKCKKITFFYDEKKVLIVEEDPMNADYSESNLQDIDGLTAHEALLKDASASFKVAKVSPQNDYYKNSALILGEWLAKRKLVSLFDYCERT